MIFYGQPNREVVNSVNIFLMDPRYVDLKMVLIEIKEIVDVGKGSGWTNDSHKATLTTIWKEREQDSGTPCPTQTSWMALPPR